MAKQTINLGTSANDGTGTPARDAFDICNDNFTELYDGKLALDGSTEMTGDLVFAEAADHSSTPAAGKGYLWVKSDTPSSLIFTDDAGTDYDLTDITSTPEGTAILSTGEAGGTKFLREDGDGTSSWQAIPAPEGTSVLSTGPVTDGYVLTADGAGGAAWEAAAGGGAFTADANGLISATSAPVLDEATGDEVAYTFEYTTNKATSGNDTGLLINQTDTASPGTSLLADFQVGGVSKVSISPAVITTAIPVWSSDVRGASNVRVSSPTGYFGLRDVGTRIYSDANSQVDLRNSTNAQTFNVYNTYTDASNYERGFMKWNTNVLEIGTEAAGTGTARDLRITSAGGDIFIDDTIVIPTNVGVSFGNSSVVDSGGTLFVSSQNSQSVIIRVGAALRASLTATSVQIKNVPLELEKGYTVATLPTASVGMITRVTDADTPVIGSAVTGGGAAFALVCYNGSAWNVCAV